MLLNGKVAIVTGGTRGIVPIHRTATSRRQNAFISTPRTADSEMVFMKPGFVLKLTINNDDGRDVNRDACLLHNNSGWAAAELHGSYYVLRRLRAQQQLQDFVPIMLSILPNV